MFRYHDRAEGGEVMERYEFTFGSDCSNTGADSCSIIDDPHGKYVLYADAEQELERLREIMREYRSRCSEMDNCEEVPDCCCSTCRKADEVLK
jgi:hypothetical protein